MDSINSCRFNNYFSLNNDYNNYINEEIEKLDSLNDSNNYDEILNNNQKYMNVKNIKRRNRKINSSQDDINMLKIKMNIDLLSNKMSQIKDAITKMDTYNINSKRRKNKRKNNSMENIFEPQYNYDDDNYNINNNNLNDYKNLYFNNDNYNNDEIYNNYDYDYDMNKKYNTKYTPSSSLLLSARQKNNILDQNLFGNNYYYNNLDYNLNSYNYNNNNYNITHDFFTINNNKNKNNIKKKNKNLKNIKRIKNDISNENIKNNIQHIKSNINNKKNNNVDNFNICEDNMCFGSYDHYFLETLTNFDNKKNKKKSRKCKSKEKEKERKNNKEKNDDIIKNNSLSSLENENDYNDPDDNIHINYMKKKEISKKIIDRNIKKEEKEEPPPESPLLNKLINIDNKIKNKNDGLIDLNDLQIKMEAVAKENENDNIMSEDKKSNEEENEKENNFIKCNKKKRKISFHEDENITIEYDKRDEITKISIFNFFGEKQNFKPRNINVILEKLKRRKINPILLTSISRNNFKKVIKNKKSFSRSNSKSKEKMKKSSSTKLLNSNKYKLNNGRPLYDKMYKDKVNKRHKICEKFKNNPQKFYSTNLNDLMIKNLVYESESDKENKNNIKNDSNKKENKNKRKEKDENVNLNDMESYNNLQKIIEESDEEIEKL